MSFKKNLIFNYASQIYVTIISIIMVPMYIKYMGIEAYGLVGFFAIFQGLFGLLDMGLTPTIAREASRYRGGATKALTFRRLLRTLEGIFLITAFLSGTALFFASDFIARNWLERTSLPFEEVKIALELMAIIIALRWMGGLYRGVITGSERLVWLGFYNSLIASLSFLFVLPILLFVGASPEIFFGSQLVIAIVEFLGIWFYGYSLLPKISGKLNSPWELSPLKPVLKFSLTIAFTSTVWILITQVDKLILSKILPLTEFAYFSLAVMVAGGIMLIGAPVSSALMSRMSVYEARGDQPNLILIYRRATQLVSVIVGATSITLVFCAEQILWAWTGDKALAHQAAPILILYALGNAILALAAFPYYLQYAKGNLRLHWVGNALFVIILVPIVIWSANEYGGLGAGYVWLGINLLFLLAWAPLVHSRFEPGLNFKWYTKDISIIIIAAASSGYFFSYFFIDVNSRFLQIIEILFFGLCVTLASASASSYVRNWVVQSFCKFRSK